jgi:hypothetical protein
MRCALSLFLSMQRVYNFWVDRLWKDSMSLFQRFTVRISMKFFKLVFAQTIKTGNLLLRY